ncbi:MAG: XrtA/PEP-CTERM system-associated ATPase [Pseudomonadota bacterium]
MYEEYYGLTASPFRLTPDKRFYFVSEGQRKAMSYLRYGLFQAEGFIVITGDVGLGKSTLIEQLFDDLDEDVVAAQIGTTQVDADDALRLICDSFGIEHSANDKASLLATLETFLVEQHDLGRRVLVVVDEAQNLPMRTLEELRMLSNLSIDGKPLLQCFLVGQPQFLSTLAHPDLAQLQQRVIASYRLEPMTEEETCDYIQHRLGAVGWEGAPDIDASVYPVIHAECEGVPRRINTLANRILLQASLEEAMAITPAMVEAVITEMHGEAVSAALPLGSTSEASTDLASAIRNGAEWQDPNAPAAVTLNLTPPGAPASAVYPLPKDFAPHLPSPETERLLHALTARIERIEASLAQHETALAELIDLAVNELRRPAGTSSDEGPDDDGPARALR